MSKLRIAIVSIGFLAATSNAWGGSKVFVGSKAAQSRLSMDQIDHSLFDRLLKKHVDSDGFVNYRAIKASSQDTKDLGRYLAILSTADPHISAKRESKLAFWINAYNAATLQGMLREYPTTSIKNHVARVYGYNIWKDLQLYVGGTPFSLEQMEHEILRKMNDPRIHFAIVCASKGCPRLLNEAYVPARVNEQLEVNSRDFFARRTNFRHAGNRMYLSAILKWYGGDFGTNQADQLKSYAKWLPTESARQAALTGSVRVSFLTYDWSINEQPANKRVVNRQVR